MPSPVWHPCKPSGLLKAGPQLTPTMQPIAPYAGTYYRPSHARAVLRGSHSQQQRLNAQHDRFQYCTRAQSNPHHAAQPHAPSDSTQLSVKASATAALLGERCGAKRSQRAQKWTSAATRFERASGIEPTQGFEPSSPTTGDNTATPLPYGAVVSAILRWLLMTKQQRRTGESDRGNCGVSIRHTASRADGSGLQPRSPETAAAPAISNSHPVAEWIGSVVPSGRGAWLEPLCGRHPTCAFESRRCRCTHTRNPCGSIVPSGRGAWLLTL